MNKEENSKILYKITAYDSDFIKEIPDKVRTIGGTLNYYYDCKKHRYLSQFVSDDFDIYDEFKRLIEENTHLQQKNQQLEEKINKAIKYIEETPIGSILEVHCGEEEEYTNPLLEILK